MLWGCDSYLSVSRILRCCSGFLSIDCGGKTNRTDSTTGISWVSDDHFINDGETEAFNDSSLPFYLQTGRIFRKPVNKSCYQLSLTPKIPHLLRIWFTGSSYCPDNRQFNYSIETREMLALRPTTIRTNPPLPSENILISNGSELYICLVRISEDVDPFISAIELRRLNEGMYNVTPEKIWHMYARYDAGSTSTVRYPDDQFDRIWNPLPKENLVGTHDVSLQKPIAMDDAVDLPPTTVMQTALATNLNATRGETLDLYFQPIQPGSLFLLYFADEFTMSESRSFDILINNNWTPLTTVRLVRPLSTVERQFVYPEAVSIITLSPNFNCGTIFNAFEIYSPIHTAAFTFPGDVQAMNVLKLRVNFSNWVSDPCFGFPWEGINCSNSTSVVRVSGINLSGRNLRGSIPRALGNLTALVTMSLNDNHLTGVLPNLSNLTKLERLYLQNNNLSGPVPDWLTALPNLKELSIESNNFSGPIPRQLLNPSLNLIYYGNVFLYPPPSHLPKVGIIVGVSVGGVVVIALAFLAAILTYRRKLRNKKDYSMVLVPNPTKSRAFTLAELLTATENLTNKIGQGGFGSVYLGKLQEGKQIAVKVLSSFSKQGVVQFLNEIDLLSKINHRNLVSLLGYCNESRELMLVYDYMPGGSLKDHLYGPNAGQYPNLDLKTRLQIALDAAQGMEYLHVSCSPKIIHSDVKSANILLDANLNGKLADFGLSRMAMDDEASHITTTVKGTAGYLDPEYCCTQMLTEKSDVYSFGVVLLEIISGRRPVDFRLCEEEMNLIRWVTPYLKGDEELSKISEIVDKRLGDDYDTKSIIQVARMALRCVESNPSVRPSISDVVIEMKEVIKCQKCGQISITDSSGPKEMDSSVNSSSFSLEGR